MFILDESSTFCADSWQIFNLIAKVIFILKIAIPIIIVLLAILDLGKAVMAGEEKGIKEAQSMLIKRLIYGVCIFLVTTVVQVVFGLVNGNGDSTGTDCWTTATSLTPFSETNPSANQTNQ